MTPNVKVLTPNIETAEDYGRIYQQLSKLALDYLDRYEHEFVPDDEFRANIDGVLVWGEFRKAFRNGRGLFMTWEELRLLPFAMLDNTVKFLLGRGFLKEVYMEWPPASVPLCPFCGKPYAYPIKARKLVFFTKISAWSCANKTCRMYQKRYLL